jgi:predicted RNA binding protein YcfA (HicA-like mRNA interferase family)
MPKLPGVPHLAAIRALQKAGFRISRLGQHVVMSDGREIRVGRYGTVSPTAAPSLMPML